MLTALEIEYPDDGAFLVAFEHVAFSPSRFRHRDHLRTAWAYIKRIGFAEAEAYVCDGIRRLAGSVGADRKYHDTLTRGWVRVVAHFEAHSSPAWSFDEFVAGHPQLLNGDLLLAHYRAETLASPSARIRWVAPDLEPFPDLEV